MKNIKYYTIILAVGLSMAISSVAMASCNHQEDWKKKLLSEKIAFLSAEMDITPEEAQAFWPIYNQVNKEREKATFEVFGAYKELSKAVDENRPEKEIGQLLEKYLKAQENQRKVEGQVAEKYSKVLPMDKVAKLYVGEEKFRRNHIRKLHGGPKHQANK